MELDDALVATVCDLRVPDEQDLLETISALQALAVQAHSAPVVETRVASGAEARLLERCGCVAVGERGRLLSWSWREQRGSPTSRNHPAGREASL